MEWRNQVAVVTGGSRGIGRATARLLSQRGAAVCLNYAMNSDAAKALVAEITTGATEWWAVKLGTDPDALARTLTTTRRSER